MLMSKNVNNDVSKDSPIRKKRDLRKNIPVSDDVIWEDREKKKQLEFIVNAFELDKRLSTWQFIY